MSYFRIQHPDRPNILDPEHQTSESYNNVEDIRTGVSVCDSREELAEYIAQTGITWNDSWELIECDGHRADDEDQDAHLGARLIHPTTIIAREPIEESFMMEIFDAFDILAAA